MNDWALGMQIEIVISVDEPIAVSRISYHLESNAIEAGTTTSCLINQREKIRGTTIVTATSEIG